MVWERQAVEVDERVAHGVLEGVRRRAPARVPDTALVQPGGAVGGPTAGVVSVLEEDAEEEEEGLESGGDEGSGQGGEQVERLHGCWPAAPLPETGLAMTEFHFGDWYLSIFLILIE